MRLTDVAVAVSKSAGQRLVELKSTPPDKLRIVPNGIHAGPFRERNDAERARLAGSLGPPSTTQLVGFVGRLNWAKDLVSLVVSFRSGTHTSEIQSQMRITSAVSGL